MSILKVLFLLPAINVSLVFFLYVLLNLKAFLKNYFLVSLIFISILIIIVSCGNEFNVKVLYYILEYFLLWIYLNTMVM